MAYQFPVGTTAQQRNRIVDAFCSAYSYPSAPIEGTTITGDGTNADRMRFFQYRVRQFIHEVNRSQRGETASNSARAAAIIEADADTATLD